MALVRPACGKRGRRRGIRSAKAEARKRRARRTVFSRSLPLGGSGARSRRGNANAHLGGTARIGATRDVSGTHLKFSHSRREIIPFLTVIAPSAGDAATIAASRERVAGANKGENETGRCFFARPANRARPGGGRRRPVARGAFLDERGGFARNGGTWVPSLSRVARALVTRESCCAVGILEHFKLDLSAATDRLIKSIKNTFCGCSTAVSLGA